MAEHRSSNRLRNRLLAVSASAAVLAAGLVAVSPLSAGATTGTTWTVDCSRKSNGDGLTAPWNSVSAVDRHGAFAPGDVIRFKRGTTCKGQLHPQGSGVPGSPITITSYGSGAKPTIAGGGTANFTGAVQLVNQQWWTVQGLHVTNAVKSGTTKTYRSGVLLLNSGVGRLAGLTVQRMTIDSVSSNPGNGNTRAYGGISALTFGKAPSGFDGLRILDNSISKVSRTGIISSNAQYPKAYDRDVRIAGNTLRHIRGDGIVTIGVQHARIDHNAVSGAADLGACSHCGRIGGPSTASAGIWPSAARWVTIDHNEVSGTRKTGGDGEAFDVDRSSRDVVVQHNYAHDNEGGGVMFCGATDATVRQNVLENNGTSAITFTCMPRSKNVRIYNNTIYQAASVKASWVVRTSNGFGATGIRFFNNIVYSYGHGQYKWPSKPYSAANTLIGFHSSTAPRGSGTSWAAPGLKRPGTGGNGFGSLGGYRLVNPAKAPRGVAIPKDASTDVFGKHVSTSHPIRGAASTR